MEICQAVLQIILKVIQDNGYTEKYVANSCDLAPSFFSDWKRGRRNSPGFDKVFKILRFLKISLDSINIENGTFSYVEQNITHQSIVENGHKEEGLTEDEQRLLAKYRSLDMDGKDSVKGFIVSEQRRYNSVRGTDQGDHRVI